MKDHLTKPLPAFTRQQVLHAAPLDVNELLTEMTGMLDRLIGATSYVALALAPNLPLALADRGQVEQVVMNLVVNARNAMPRGGSVTIETADIELENSPFHEEAVTQGHYVMLAITDSGSGMTKESKETGPGTGLGLSTTVDIVKQSNGYTWVYSEPGRGTTFKVYLPRANGDVPLPAFSPVIATPAKSASETVLLVDDDAGVRQFSKRILDAAGYRVFEAADGNAAERLFAEHADSIDLVVTDVIMPGCGGTELLGRLRLRAPAVRVLYMSGYPESVAQRPGIDRGFPFVEKPFTVEGFMRRVREALNG
jgi:two-component system cell cycle sensor histidine kinase/response regulator CckA